MLNGGKSDFALHHHVWKEVSKGLWLPPVFPWSYIWHPVVWEWVISVSDNQTITMLIAEEGGGLNTAIKRRKAI